MRCQINRLFMGTCIVISSAWFGISCARLRAGGTAAAPPEEPPTLPPLTEAGQKRAEAYARYSVGLFKEQQRDIPAALSNYMRAAELDPDNESLQLRIAVLLLQERRTEEAIALLERMVAQPNASDKPVMLLAMVYEASENFKGAEAAYNRLLTAYPDHQEIYANLARLYLRQNDAEKAIKVLSMGIDKVQDPSELLTLLVATHMSRAAQADDPKRCYRDAVEALEKLRQRRPDDHRLELQIADLCLRAGDYERALTVFEELEEAMGDSSEVIFRLAKMLAATGNYDQTLAALERIAADRSNNVERILFYMGAVSEAMGRLDRAAEHYERAATGKHAQVSAYVALAAIQSTNLAQASATIARGLERFPEHPMLLNVMANIYFLREAYSDATAYFDRVLKSAEQAQQSIRNPAFFMNYSIALQKIGDLDAAAKRLYDGVKIKPDLLESYLQFVFQQTNTVAQKESLAVLEKLGELQPNEPAALLYVGVLNLYLKSYSEAMKSFEKVERLVRDSGGSDEILDAQFYFWYGSAAERAGDFQRAETLFLKCIELDPQHAEALNYIAYMWAERGMQLDRALEFVKRALAIQPTSGAFVDTLGWIYYMQGNYTQALAEVTRAAELIPGDPTILEHLGDIFEKLGNEDQAIPHWKRAYVLDPSNENLAQKLIKRGVDLESLKQEAMHLQHEKQSISAPEIPSPPKTPVLPLVLPTENEPKALPDESPEKNE